MRAVGEIGPKPGDCGRRQTKARKLKQEKIMWDSIKGFGNV